MKWVWGLTTLYSGPLGLLVYAYSGRRQIRRDSLWRRGFRSVAHCYSGCGAGEVVGVFIAAGLLSMGNLAVTVITFALAYVFGYAMTVGPLLEQGVGLRRAVRDALYSETASITVMEISALTVNNWLSSGTHLGHVLFWTALIVSLSVGLIVAYPVNLLLIHYGVKQGMASPKSHSAA
ncbi:MAG: DUF4396 domain-containing protein [Gammaproteobacteria bacterium]